MSSAPGSKMTADEYLRYERQSSERHEYVRGELYLQAGASRAHCLICTNLIVQIGQQIRGRACEVYSHDMRVRIKDEGPYFYPDVVALCGEPEVIDEAGDMLANPSLIVEVLSRSTEGFDRSAKGRYYRQLASLNEYVIVDQYSAYVERYRRQQGDRWQLDSFQDLGDVVQLDSIGCQLTLAHIYAKVEFPVPKVVRETPEGSP